MSEEIPESSPASDRAFGAPRAGASLGFLRRATYGAATNPPLIPSFTLLTGRLPPYLGELGLGRLLCVRHPMQLAEPRLQLCKLAAPAIVDGRVQGACRQRSRERHEVCATMQKED